MSTSIAVHPALKPTGQESSRQQLRHTVPFSPTRQVNSQYNTQSNTRHPYEVKNNNCNPNPTTNRRYSLSNLPLLDRAPSFSGRGEIGHGRKRRNSMSLVTEPFHWSFCKIRLQSTRSQIPGCPPKVSCGLCPWKHATKGADVANRLPAFHGTVGDTQSPEIDSLSSYHSVHEFQPLDAKPRIENVVLVREV